MTTETLIVAALVAMAAGYLLWTLLLRRRGACDKCSLYQAVTGVGRRNQGTTPNQTVQAADRRGLRS